MLAAEPCHETFKAQPKAQPPFSSCSAASTDRLAESTPGLAGGMIMQKPCRSTTGVAHQSPCGDRVLTKDSASTPLQNWCHQQSTVDDRHKSGAAAIRPRQCGPPQKLVAGHGSGSAGAMHLMHPLQTLDASVSDCSDWVTVMAVYCQGTTLQIQADSLWVCYCKDCVAGCRCCKPLSRYIHTQS